MSKLEIQETGDGSHTLFSEKFNEIYHSRHGALQESVHVFIQAGLESVLKQKNNINLLEIGFGTGLNAILSIQKISGSKHHIHYTGIEPLPVPFNIIEQLNYLSSIDDELLHQSYKDLHLSDWNKDTAITTNFTLYKYKGSFEDFSSEKKFDLVYFDAFAPSKHPEIWDKAVFEKISTLMSKNGVLVTYCAKGQVKRDLKASGFIIEKLAGPPGKREMTRAIMNNESK